MTTTEPSFAEWVHELRTTDKPQGTGKLRSADDKFCCLGLYAELAGFERTPFRGFYAYETGHREEPLTAFLYEARPSWMERRHETMLSNINDAGRTFAEIADWAEAIMTPTEATT